MMLILLSHILTGSLRIIVCLFLVSRLLSVEGPIKKCFYRVDRCACNCCVSVPDKFPGFLPDGIRNCMDCGMCQPVAKGGFQNGIICRYIL